MLQRIYLHGQIPLYLFLFLLLVFNAFEYDSNSPLGRSYKDKFKTSQQRFLCKDRLSVISKYIMIYTLNSPSKAPLFILLGKSSMNLFIDTLCDVKLLYSTVMTSSSTSLGSSSTLSTRSDSCVEISLWSSILVSLSSTFSTIGFPFFLLKYFLLEYYYIKIESYI